MVSQLRIPMSWSKMERSFTYINKLNKLGLSDEKLKNSSYQKQCNLSNNKPVVAARYFQYRFEVFFKERILDCSLGKTKYCVMHIEFKERASLHIDSLIWIFNVLNIPNKADYIGFIWPFVWSEAFWTVQM